MSSGDAGLTIKETAQSLKEPVSRDTIEKWLHRGVLNRRTGERIFLRYEQFGGQIRIDRDSVHEFMKALNWEGR